MATRPPSNTPQPATTGYHCEWLRARRLRIHQGFPATTRCWGCPKEHRSGRRRLPRESPIEEKVSGQSRTPGPLQCTLQTSFVESASRSELQDGPIGAQVRAPQRANSIHREEAAAPPSRSAFRQLGARIEEPALAAGHDTIRLPKSRQVRKRSLRRRLIGLSSLPAPRRTAPVWNHRGVLAASDPAPADSTKPKDSHLTAYHSRSPSSYRGDRRR